MLGVRTVLRTPTFCARPEFEYEKDALFRARKGVEDL
jgi:hypothetical protein